MKRGHMIAIAFICALLAALLMFMYGLDVQATAEEQRKEMLSLYGAEQIEVCVARKDILPGDVIDSSNMTVQVWPVELLPEQAIRSLDDILNQSVTTPIFKGEVASKHHFESNTDESLQVPVGMCAISLPSKEVSAVGGRISKGSLVDVYATGAQGTYALAAELLVLSTSKESKDDTSDITWIILAVAPEQVEEFVAAAQKSELYFTLPAQDMDTSSDQIQDVLHEEDEEKGEVARGAEGKRENSNKDGDENADAEKDASALKNEFTTGERGVEVIERLSDITKESKE